MTNKEVYEFLWVTHTAINVRKFAYECGVSYSILSKFKMAYQKQDMKMKKGKLVLSCDISKDALKKIEKTAKKYGYVAKTK